MSDYEEGFYWVKLLPDGSWEIARYFISPHAGRFWNVLGDYSERQTSYFYTIGPRIPEPAKEEP